MMVWSAHLWWLWLMVMVAGVVLVVIGGRRSIHSDRIHPLALWGFVLTLAGFWLSIAACIWRH